MSPVRASAAPWLRAAGALVLLAGAATAQNPQPKSPPLPPEAPGRTPAPPEAPAPPPPYEAQLDRLSEILGTLAYMRELCQEGDGPAWHDRMTALIEAEAATGPRKERLAGNYNRGFQGYRLTYHACTPSAQAVIARALDEGAGLARELSLRFGGD